MRMKRRLTVTVLVATAMTLVAAPAMASESPSNVVPPYGNVYSQLSKQWWLWAFDTPVRNRNGGAGQFVANGSAKGPAHVDCTLGQSGPVWFLAGTDPSGTVHTANRSCTVPQGKALFFPVFDSWVDNLGSPPGTLSKAELQNAAAAPVNAITRFGTTIDGKPVRALASDPDDFRARSGRFDYRLPADSLINFSFGPLGFHFPAGTRPPQPGAYADGVYLLVKPLSPGQHVLHWTAVSDKGVQQNITYHVTVQR
jgi:hypothetical protein